MGDSEGGNHKNWGVAGGLGVLRIHICSRYGPFLALGLFDTNDAQSRPFLAILGPFLGHIVEL